MTFLILYIILVNTVSFGLFGYDKHCAVNNKWRVSEFTLLTLAFCGGAFGESRNGALPLVKEEC